MLVRLHEKIFLLFKIRQKRTNFHFYFIYFICIVICTVVTLSETYSLTFPHDHLCTFGGHADQLAHFEFISIKLIF